MSVQRSLLCLSLCLLSACKSYDVPGRAPAAGGCCEGAGTCIPAVLVPGGVARRLAQGECAEALLCAPSAWLSDPNPQAAHCRTGGDREGRCLPSCLPEVSAQAERLERETCAAQELCVPCFDPLSGADSLACRIGADAPEEKAAPFPRCCSGEGRCLPGELLSESVPADQVERLGADSCEGEALCVPERWLGEGEARSAICRTAGAREGRCLPSCLPEVREQAERLAREDCESHERCVPCFDPLSGEDTGACRAGKDKPKEKAMPFPQCCAGRGRCLPDALLAQSIAEDDRARLAHDACEEDALCVPEPWIAAASPPAATCRATGGLEGRCLPTCLPDVAAQAESLSRANCGDSELCVPCYDPLSGKDTEACRIGADRPREPARTFETCCGQHGLCVPEQSLLQSLSVEERARLDATSCAAESHALCVPELFLGARERGPTHCRAAGQLEGRCLPSCLPEVAEQSERLQQRDCDREERCVPCFDPLTGEDTKACRVGDDRPVEPARGYERCCGAPGAELGTCLPIELLSAEQLDSLPADSCRRAGTRCAPSELVEGAQPTRCNVPSFSTAASVGLCLPECFIPAPARLFTPRATCGAARRCVACQSLTSGQPGCE